MKNLLKSMDLEIFRPREYLESIYSIDFARLRDLGFTAILMDLDETLLPREMSDITPVLYSFLESIKDKGFQICLVSNNLNPDRVIKVSQALSLPHVTLAVKPLPFAFDRARKLLGVGRGQAAVIGDQLFMDILGGNLAGLYTILVKPMTRETSFWRRWMRKAERFVLGKLNYRV